MKAAVLKKSGGISVEDVETPKANIGEVVIKVSCCGICGADLHRFGGADLHRFWSTTPEDEIIGHEISGVIAEIGHGVHGWSVGQRVTPILFAPCWHCYYCTHGMPHRCLNTGHIGGGEPGGYAEFVKVKTSQLYATPEEITDQEAALAEPLAVSLRAVLLSRVTIGSSVAIIGAGPIGLFVIQCARLSGARSIFVAQRSAVRASMAKRMGADVVINPDKEDFISEVQRQTTVGADASFECVGTSKAFQLASRSVRMCGRVVLVGLGGPAEFDISELVFRELEIKGSIIYWTEFADSLELLRLRKISTAGIVTKIVPLKDIEKAFVDLLHSKDQIKVLVAP